MKCIYVLGSCNTKAAKLTKGESLLVSNGFVSTGGHVVGVKADFVKIILTGSTCNEASGNVAISRGFGRRISVLLVGLKIRRGTVLEAEAN